jgi:hypothetical protein
MENLIRDLTIVYEGGLYLFSGIFSGLLVALSLRTKNLIDPKNKYSPAPKFGFIILFSCWSIFVSLILFFFINYIIGIAAIISVLLIYTVFKKFIKKFMIPNFLEVALSIWTLLMYSNLIYINIDKYKIFPSIWSEEISVLVSILVSFIILILVTLFLPISFVNKLKKFVQYEY